MSPHVLLVTVLLLAVAPSVAAAAPDPVRTPQSLKKRSPSLRDIIGRWTPVEDPDCSKDSLSVVTVTPKRFLGEASHEAECDVVKWEPAEDAGRKGFSSLVSCQSEGDSIMDAIHLAPLPGNRLQMRSRRWNGTYRRCPRRG
jgi:hypothetical protein